MARGIYFLFLIAPLLWAKSAKVNSVTLSANIPHVINLNYDVRVRPWLSVGLGVGYFGLKVQTAETGPMNLSTENYEGHLRLHPFSGAFFLGLLVGHQKYFGEMTRSIAVPSLFTSVSLTGSADIKSYYVTPHIGWFWRWESGFTLGFDLGWQISISPETAVNIPIPAEYAPYVNSLPEYQDFLHDAEEVGDKLGSLSIPFITLIRFGWSF